MALDSASDAPLDTMFASRSVPVHLVRGALGIPLLVAAFALIPTWGPVTLLLAVPAVVLLRGCPTCWMLGLAQTQACVAAGRCAPGQSAGFSTGSSVDDAAGAGAAALAGTRASTSSPR